MKKIIIPLICSCLLACQPSGPAEQQGKNIDKAVESIQDRVNPPGPAEKAGSKIDSAAGH